MTLREYREARPIPAHECIFRDKMEEIFKRISNGDDVLQFLPTDRLTIADQFIEMMNTIPSDKTYTITMSNADNDIPFIQPKWMSTADWEYSVGRQAEIESKDIDYFIDDRVLRSIPGNVRIFCHSVIKDHPSLNMYPLGRDYKGKNYDITKFEISEKTQLCYLNCSVPPIEIHWYGRIREHIYLGLKDKDFVVCENVSTHSPARHDHNNFMNYFAKLASSKFMIAPRGCGIDTYRLWDSIYLGCIPIVVKYDGYKQFEDLPILFIDRWQNYLELTEEQLEKVWDEFQDKDFNYEKLKTSYWIEKITNK